MQRPLRNEHLNFLELCKARSTNLQVQADWAAKGWAQTLVSLFGVLLEPKSLHWIGLDAPSIVDASSSRPMARDFVRLMLRTASARAWSMAIWSELPPFSWAAIAHSDEAVRKTALQTMESDYEVVAAATGLVSSSAANASEIQGVLNTLWFHHLTLVQAPCPVSVRWCLLFSFMEER